MNNWTRVDKELPPQNTLVDTISEGGVDQKLKLSGKLWFVEDGQVYVYYTVVFWREL